MCKLIIFASFLILGACTSVPQGTIESFSQLNPETNKVENLSFVTYDKSSFKKFLKQHAEIQLVDVRTLKEYQAGHISNAILIDVKKDDFMNQAVDSLDSERPVAVYCRSGVRSRKAAKILSLKGFKVYNLDKGYTDWVK